MAPPQGAAIFFQDDIFRYRGPTTPVPVEIPAGAGEDATTPRKDVSPKLPAIQSPRRHVGESSAPAKKQVSGQVAKLPNILLHVYPENLSTEKKKPEVADLESQHEHAVSTSEAVMPVTKFGKSEKNQKASKRKATKHGKDPGQPQGSKSPPPKQSPRNAQAPVPPPPPPPPPDRPMPAYRPPRREYMSDFTKTVRECFRVHTTTHGAAVMRGDGVEKEVEQVEASQSEMANYRVHVKQEVSALQRARARRIGERRKKQELENRSQPTAVNDHSEASGMKHTISRAHRSSLARAEKKVRIHSDVGDSTDSKKLHHHKGDDHHHHHKADDHHNHKAPPQKSDSQKLQKFFAISEDHPVGETHHPSEKEAKKLAETLDLDNNVSGRRHAERFASGASNISVGSQGHPEETKKPKSGILNRLKNKNDRMKAIHKAQKEKSREQRRALKELAMRIKEFNSLPEDEQKLSRLAFEIGEDDRGYLISADLLHLCLTELGLGGTGDRELAEISQMCAELSAIGDLDLYAFTLDLVPAARDKLTDLRRHMLFESFCLYDEDGSGFLDFDECLKIVEKLCSRDLDSTGMDEVTKEFRIVFKDMADDDEVDFEGFQTLVAKIKEKHQRVRVERERHVIEKFALSAEELKMHRDELLPLYESFSSQDVDGSGDLDTAEVQLALLENGLLPRKDSERERLMDIIERTTADGMNFKGFLQLIRMLREECRSNRRLALRRQFKRYDKDGSGDLSLAEVALLFIDMGLTPRCQDDQDEMKALLREVDADGSGELDFNEFQDLVQRITERLRFSQRRRENETAKSLGFTLQQVTELRESFFSLDQDGSGELTIEECRTTLTLMRKSMTAEDLNVLFATIDKDGNGRIDFEEFLQFMKSLSDPRVFDQILTTGRTSFMALT